MRNEQLISADEFCNSHQIEISFIYSLNDWGLVQITKIEEKSFIDLDQLNQLERMVRLHYDMDINLEGIETITHLLLQADQMKNEIARLKNEIHFYSQTA